MAGLSVLTPGASVARVDVVVWARALGVSSADDVVGELRRAGTRVAEVLELLQALVDEVSTYPDEALAAELRTAYGHVEEVGANVAHAAHVAGSQT